MDTTPYLTSKLTTDIPTTGAKRPRTLTIKDLEQLIARYERGRSAAYETECAAEKYGDEYTMAMHLYYVYARLLGKLEPVVKDAYARYGHYQLPHLLGAVTSITVANLIAEFASLLVYAKLIYTQYPAVIATIAHEIALVQSYVGVHIEEAGVATDEELFA